MGAYWWASSLADLYTEVGLIIIVIILVAVVALFLLLRGRFGALFWHSGNMQIGMEIEPNGQIDAYSLKNFGSLKQVNSGPKKGQIIIPRPRSTYRSPGSPAVSIIAGRGVGQAVPPILAEYLRHARGEWATWTGSKPPKAITDVNSMYIAYAEAKSKAETE